MKPNASIRVHESDRKSINGVFLPRLFCIWLSCSETALCYTSSSAVYLIAEILFGVNPNKSQP